MRVFHDPVFKKRFRHLLFPIFIQEVLVVLINTISSFIIGAVNQDALSGCNIANNIFLIFNMVVLGIAVAGSVFVAQYQGKKDYNSINKVFNFTLELSVIWALIFTIICVSIPRQIINIFTPANENIIKYGATYLRFFSISFIFRAVCAMYYYSVKNLGKTKIIIFNSLSTLIINTCFCCIFVFGCHLDSLGAAISLIISRFVEMAVIIIYMRRFNETKVKFTHLIHPDKNIRREMLRYLLPIFGARIAWSIGAIMSSVVLGRLGGDVIAASSTITVCRDIIVCAGAAGSSAANILLGQELGANELDKASKHGDDVMRYNFVIGAINVFVFISLCGIFFLIGQNTFSLATKNYLWQMMLIYLISVIPQVYNGVCHDGILCTGGDKLFVFLNNFLSMWLVTIPLGFISLYLEWPPLLTFFLILSDELVKFPILMIHYFKRKWVKKIV